MKFALIGAAGYIAPRHMKAIAENGGEVIAAMDPYDGVGIMDSHFPKASFFTEFERFDRHLEKLKRSGNPVDYLSVCSPNYLHDAHIRFGLRSGMKVICEKPIVLNPWNLDGLLELTDGNPNAVNTILQLRLHPAVKALKEKVEKSTERHKVDLTYITSRGMWYHSSWKGEISKSGGVITNIGVHFFDMLSWIFGEPLESDIHQRNFDRASGYLKFEKADVSWFLSINSNTLPKEVVEKGQRTFRTISIDGEELDMSVGFEDLHTLSYREILKGNGFDLNESRRAIEITHALRTAELSSKNGNEHPFSHLPEENHPFL
ncbi:MAG: Gfo/Idh/MocA family oxidoreductase [Schleiferiaceae bacterium]